MFAALRHDMRRYEDLGGWHRNLGFWVTATYRFGRWARSVRPEPLQWPLRAAHAVLAAPWRFVRSVYLPCDADIGPGLYLAHPEGIYVPPGAVVGESCSIFNEVTLGLGSVPGVPSLGEHVVVFPGARLLGGITVGAGAHVGANAVVTKSIPAGSYAVAVPPRIVPANMATSLRERPSPKTPGDDSEP